MNNRARTAQREFVCRGPCDAGSRELEKLDGILPVGSSDPFDALLPSRTYACAIRMIKHGDGARGSTVCLQL